MLSFFIIYQFHGWAGILSSETSYCQYTREIAPLLTQSFNLLRLIESVPGGPGNFAFKNKLSPRSESSLQVVKRSI